MLPPERRLPAVGRLIEREHYFVIHAPRQSGKTTLVRAVVEQLNAEDKVVAVHATCETAQTARGDIDRGVRAVLRAIDQETHFLAEELRPEPVEAMAHVETEGLLREYLARWSRKSPKPVVLFLDEIDALKGDGLLSVLRQLRAGYPSRPAQFPAAICLVAQRDIPFGMKIESIRLRDLSLSEVAELLSQHTALTGQNFTDAAIASIWDLTRGQAGLVNRLAHKVVMAFAGEATESIDRQQVSACSKDLLEGRIDFFDSLTERLGEPRVHRTLDPILKGQLPSLDVLDDDIAFVKDLGLLKVGSKGLEIVNPIYRELVSRHYR